MGAGADCETNDGGEDNPPAVEYPFAVSHYYYFVDLSSVNWLMDHGQPPHPFDWLYLLNLPEIPLDKGVQQFFLV